MRKEPVHAFGHLTHADPALLQHVSAFLVSWGLEADLELEGALLRFDYEGVYFPHEDLLEALSPLHPAAEGRFDIIDREAWTLTRYVIARGSHTLHVVPLNHVLSYSGF